jgi:N-sulfoglucosamine sulfohydrolase
MLTRREMIAGSAAALMGCTGPRSEKRPNVLFAIADDQSFPHAGYYKDPVVQTPAFDRVAREGIVFNNSFANCPSCTPSRSSILTGRNVWQVEDAGVLYGTIPRKFPLFTHLMENDGYHVGYTGKPWQPGNWQAGGLERHPNCAEYNERLMEPPAPEGIDVRDYSANFEDFLAARNGDDPFFFWYGCTEPHRVYGDGLGRKSGKRLEDVQVPGFLPDTETVRSDILDYYFEIEWFDRHVARMIESLERIGELDNTIIVVTSDNGMPFPRAKVNLYDLGVHMPLAIRWGDKLTGGAIMDDFVSHIDFAPTFLTAAGIATPEGMAGHDLFAPDAGRDFAVSALERHTYCRPDGATYPIRALHTSDYLYLRNFEPDRWPTGGPDFISSNKTPHGDVDGCPTKDFMIDHQDEFPNEYELSFGKRPEEELYDLNADPDQLTNLAEEPRMVDVKGRMWSQLESYLTDTADPRLEGRDIWQPVIYHQTIGFGATFNKALSEEERAEAGGRGAHKPE